MTIFGCFRWVLSKKWFYFAIAPPKLPWEGLEWASIEYRGGGSSDDSNFPVIILMVKSRVITLCLGKAKEIQT